MPVDSTSTTALAFASLQVDPNILSKYTHAVTIHSAPHDNGWLYRIECKEPKAYDAFSEALTATEIHLKTRCFLPILDDGGRTNGKIVLNPPSEAFQPTSVWRQPLAPQNENNLLIPGLKRLSKQLQVDFASNVHGSEGKRKREPTRTIYEENVEVKKPAKVRKPTPDRDASPIAEKPPKPATEPQPAKPTTTEYSFAEKALDAVNASHTEAMAAKDETIRALTSALAMREDLVRTQASLIALLQRGPTHSP